MPIGLIAISAAALLFAQDEPPPLTFDDQAPVLADEAATERRLPPDPFETSPNVEIVRDRNGRLAAGWVRSEECRGQTCHERVEHAGSGRAARLFGEMQAGCLATGRGEEIVCLAPPSRSPTQDVRITAEDE